MTWTDNFIQVIIPSSVQENLMGGRSAGSGPFEVVRQLPDPNSAFSTQILNIEYSVQSSIYGNTIAEICLANNRCGGLVFTLDSTILQNPQFFPAIDSALTAWSTAISFPLTLERDSLGNLLYSNRNGAEALGKNMIYLNEIDGVVGGATLAQKRGIGIDDQKIVNTKYGFAINSATNWDYSLSGSGPLAADTYSLYQVSLHELGHNLGLRHDVVIDSVQAIDGGFGGISHYVVWTNEYNLMHEKAAIIEKYNLASIQASGRAREGAQFVVDNSLAYPLTQETQDSLQIVDLDEDFPQDFDINDITEEFSCEYPPIAPHLAFDEVASDL